MSEVHYKRIYIDKIPPFESVEDFRDCINHGGEVVFAWKGVTYGVIRYGTDNKITIYVGYHPETEMVCETADDALDYMLGEDRFGDVLTQVEVIERTV